MFGLISKKRLIKEALDIYLEEDTDKASGETPEMRVKDFFYRAGNANALNGLCSRLGIDLTDYVISAKALESIRDTRVRGPMNLKGEK